VDLGKALLMYVASCCESSSTSHTVSHRRQGLFCTASLPSYFLPASCTSLLYYFCIARISLDLPNMAKFEPPLPNPALFTDEHHEIYMGDSPELDPKPYECIVHVRCNGICG
jgi:hypothetical protein